MKSNEFYETYIKELPDGIEKFVAETIVKHHGEERALPRERLAKMVEEKFRGLVDADRAARKAIYNLRDEMLIGNISNGDGYYICTSREEFEKFVPNYCKRAYSAIQKIEKMKKIADQLWPAENNGPKQLSLI